MTDRGIQRSRNKEQEGQYGVGDDGLASRRAPVSIYSRYKADSLDACRSHMRFSSAKYIMGRGGVNYARSTDH